MSSIFKHILVVEQAESEEFIALERAVSIANNANSKITVMLCLYHQIKQGKVCDQALDDMTLFVREQQQKVCEYFNRLTDKDLSLDIIISWQEPTEVAVEKVVTNKHVSLIIKPYSYEKHFLDLFTSTLDRFLTRTCSLPVWLVKPGYYELENNILACLDIEDASHANHELNESILDSAEQLLPLIEGEMHFVDCFFGEPGSIAIHYDPDTGFRKGVSERSKHQRGLQKALCQHPKLKGTLHIEESMPDDAIPKTAELYHAGLTIIGNDKPDNIINRAIGDTTQILVENIQTDLLIVKAL